jgi:Cof subfamily protein (haloacid dehalogenase superfamily)
VTSPIRLVVSDVDGTLVTSDKVLTPASVAAVGRLHEAGIRFAVTSGRPPRGMAMLVGPLSLRDPIGGFNGGLVVRPDLTMLEERSLPPAIVQPLIDTLDGCGVDVWCYEGSEWLLRDEEARHVAREAATVEFAPTVRASFDSLADDVVKIVGVSDDASAIAAALGQVRATFGTSVSASTSQPYYLDVTHPDANKGRVVAYLSSTLGIAPDAIATIGDGANDVLMFERSGLSIAMGSSSAEVRDRADKVTRSNDEDGFAYAMEHFVMDPAP